MDDKVTHFPLLPVNDVPKSLKAWAGRFERGEETCVRAVLVFEEADGNVRYSCLGAEPFTMMSAVGMLEFAKQEMMG